MNRRDLIVEEIKKHCKINKISFSELSSRIGKSPSYIQKFCGTEKKPAQLPLDIATKISKELSIPMTVFSDYPIESSDNSMLIFKYFLVFLRENKISLNDIDIDSCGRVFIEISSKIPQTTALLSSTLDGTKHKAIEESTIKGMAITFLLEENKHIFLKKIL